METKYTVKAKNTPDVWEFTYSLDGVLKRAEFLNVQLNPTQINWLFIKGNFPYCEAKINHWQTLKANFDITVNAPEPTFEIFWKTYPYNKLSNKKTAKERFEKLKYEQKIKCISKIPDYVKLKQNENQFLPYAEVYINKGWWDN